MIEKISVLTAQGEIQAWSLLADFEDVQWRVRVSDGSGEVWEGVAEEIFDAFRVLRKGPESQGIRFLVAGARVDCWPTRLSSQKGAVVAHPRLAVMMLIRNLIGYIFPRAIYRYIFSPAPASKVGTVAEQDAYQQEWIRQKIL